MKDTDPDTNPDGIFQRILVSIFLASVPAATQRLAAALLARMEPQTGQVNLTWEELCKLAICKNRQAAARHLTALKLAQLIHYSTNDYVYITFTEVMKEQAKAADPARHAQLLRVESTVARGRAQLVRVENTPTARRAQLVRAGNTPTARGDRSSLYITNTSKLSKYYEQLDLLNWQATPENAARTLALLCDDEVRLDEELARQISEKVEFEQVARQVFAWRRDCIEGKAKGVGALANRIVSGWGAGPITLADQDTALYRRHISVEDELDRRRRYVPEEYADIING